MTTVRELAAAVVQRLATAAASGAADAGALTAEEVESVLRLHGVPDSAASPPSRRVRLLRLRLLGEKTLRTALEPDGSDATAGEPELQTTPAATAQGGAQDDDGDGALAAFDSTEGSAAVAGTHVPFDRTYEFDEGLTVISGPNLRGKTTLLEVVTLLLRGSERDLQGDVAQWLRQVSLDVEVAGVALGMRVELQAGKVVRGLVLTGPEHALAASDDVAVDAVPEELTLIDDASDAEQWAEVIEGLMLSRLGLEPIAAYTQIAGKQVGTLSAHGWPAYFFALYPPAGASSSLLGGDSSATFATRLLDVFLDLPGATVKARLDSVSRLLAAQDRARSSQDEQTSQTLSSRLVSAEAELLTAQAALDALRAQQGGMSLDQLRREHDASEAAKRQAQARLSQAEDELAAAREGRVADQRLLNELQESQAVRTLLKVASSEVVDECCHRVFLDVCAG